MPSKPSTPPTPLLLGLVAISGAAGLASELLWIRALGRHFGTTTLSITTVVATFMAGLGLGYVVFGKRADQSRYPFRLYQRLELCIATSGLAVSLFLLRADTALDGLARVCAAAGPLSTACMLLVCALVMLLPTIAMGGTVPVLASALGREGRQARVLSRLYASNTLGAIAGALAPDFVVIPRWGMTAAGWLAAAGNLSVALVMHRYVSVEVVPQPLEPSELETGVERISAQRSAALALSACSGFCALGLEVLWSRTLQHWASALVTSFAVLLAMYLAALALGAFATERWAGRARQPLVAACILTGLTALCVILPLWAAPAWRDMARAWWPRPEDMRRVGLMHEAIDALLHAGFLELAPCLLMGATFPFVATAWLADGKTGARSGQLFVVNTLAGVLGSAVVGFWWLPELGEQWSYVALALLLASVAVLCALSSERVRVAALSSGACLAAAIALTVGLPAAQLFRAHFRSGGHVLAVNEGATTTAAAAARFIYGEAYYLELLTPGVSMSSTLSTARRYMSVMGHAAMLTAPHPERALLICYGVGNTAQALLTHSGLKRLDVVDTSSEVLSLSSHFATARGSADPLRDPRTHVYVDDGRHHLITQDARYDVITAEPPPPNHAAVANLYSREFYHLARERLAPAGVITQWLPVFQLSDDDVRSMIAAFVAELPHAALLYGSEQQLVLIGSMAPLRMRTVADEALTRELRNAYIGGIEDLLGSVIQTDAELRASVAQTRPLDDEQPSIQYPRADVREGTFFTSAFEPNPARALSLMAHTMDPSLQARVERAAAATRAALAALPVRELEPRELGELTAGRLLAPTLASDPDDQGLWSLLAVDNDRARLAARALSRPGASELLDKPPAAAQRARYLVLQDALWMLARRAFYARDYAHALTLFERLHPEAHDKARHALFVAGCLRALNRADESSHVFTSAAAASGNPAFREACAALATHAARPFDPQAGPWAAPPL
ncbi:MAG TPA: fused MFS/spermidine synthase [Polyangiales bacterium]|nr:fused MFS/spermidine synthase [Polyangiales bacterium]